MHESDTEGPVHGSPLDQAEQQAGQHQVRIGDRIARWIDNPWVVIASLFLVFAILGIPLVWMSKAFPTWAKVVLSIVVTIYTGLLLWGFWLIMAWSYHRIVDAL